MLRALISLLLLVQNPESLERREEYLRELRLVLPRSLEWEQWLEDSGELPPDFGAMPSRADLPDPLVRWDGDTAAAITDPQTWRAHREDLLEQFHYWTLGSVPEPPGTVDVRILSEEKTAGATLRQVELRFGPDGTARLWVELMIPDGAGPFPVFMTQHNHRGWARIALRRGYLAAIYAGSDSRDDTASFVKAYPDHDWSKLTRRAWAAGRVIDYLEQVPQADTERIALTGHSRNGKQSLIASALDERIAVVISSSSGAGGPLTARYYSEQHFGEGIENLTRQFPDWFHPRLRFFVGREHKLPIDQHQLVALSAPRPVLLSIALNDGVESTWSMEATYRAVQLVYALFDAEDNLRILRRPAGHETWPQVVERYLDWCDNHFGRGDHEFPERFIHPWDWEQWREASQSLNPMDFPARGADRTVVSSERTMPEWSRQRATIRARILSFLGDAPPAATNDLETYGEEPSHIEELLRRDSAGSGLEKHDLMFGEYLNADVYAPAGTEASGDRIPAILWLHPFSRPMGYVAAYRRGEQAYRTMARGGFAVFCYDQIGFGRRIEEVDGFYEDYPNWSLMGRMVRDARAALDAMDQVPFIDPDRIYVVGYGLGAFVGLHLGALDDRPAGYALVCGPPPFRLDTNTAETGGIARWSHRHMLLPNLGFFIGRESHVLYDVDEMLANMAPRPTLVLSPILDREAPIESVTKGVESARTVFALYDAADKLTHLAPLGYNHFDEFMQRRVVEWLNALPR